MVFTLLLPNEFLKKKNPSFFYLAGSPCWFLPVFICVVKPNMNLSQRQMVYPREWYLTCCRSKKDLFGLLQKMPSIDMMDMILKFSPMTHLIISVLVIIQLSGYLKTVKAEYGPGTENSGLNIYDKKKGVFFRLESSPTDSNSISGNNIRAIEELPDGRMLIATVGNGLNIITLPDDFFEKNVTPVITKLKMPENTEVYGMGKDKHDGFL